MAVVWVTGAKGFIGRHLSRHLAAQGLNVLGLGHGAWPAETAQQEGVSGWINGEVDAANLWQLQRISGLPSVVYHMAGGSSVGVSLQSPQEDYHRTVTSTSNLLEWVRCHSPETKIVAISSAAVYGNSNASNLTEEGPYTPFSPYGFHKKQVELMCESYVRSFGVNAIVVRLFSIYGSGLRKQLLWDVCTKLADTPHALQLQGTGEELRDWVHVSDAVRILVAASKISEPNVYVLNGGTGFGTNVRAVVQYLCDAWEQNPAITFSGQQRPGDPLSLISDNSRLSRYCDLSGAMPLRQGILDYVTWFKEKR